MSDRKFRSRLEWILLKYILISLAVSILASVVLYFSVQFILFKSAHKNQLMGREMQFVIDDLQSFITENGLTSGDTRQLEEWNNENWYAFIRIYDENGVVYDSLFSVRSLFVSALSEQNPESYEYSYDLRFADKPATLVITAYFGGLHYKTLIKTSCYGFAFLSFLLMFLCLIKKKIRYIRKIEEGIKIIESGSLEYRIPVDGDDELASLAISINDMSLAMGERLKWEAEVKQQNYDIVSAISHDIRTPLTSVVCYLDLLEAKRFRDEEERTRFLKNARQNAYLIKSLTDNLFEHSIASNENIPFRFESVSGNELIPQLVSEMMYLLEDKGFKSSFFNDIQTAYTLCVDINHFHRVFDNLSSNILKYADPNYYVDITARLENGKLAILQHNRIKSRKGGQESFSIGLRTCQDIMKRHGGNLSVEKDKENFYVTVSLKAEYMESDELPGENPARDT